MRPEVSCHVVWPCEVLIVLGEKVLVLVKIIGPILSCEALVVLLSNLLLEDYIGQFSKPGAAYRCVFGSCQRFNVLLKSESSISRS